MSRMLWEPHSTIAVLSEDDESLFALGVVEQIRDALADDLVALDVGVRNGNAIGMLNPRKGPRRSFALGVADEVLTLSIDLMDRHYPLEDYEGVEDVVEGVRSLLATPSPLDPAALKNPVTCAA